MAKFLEIEDRLKELETEHNDVALIEGFLRAYEVSSSTIARANLSDEAILNGVQIARKVFIKKCTLVRIDDELEKAIAENDRKNKTRMIVIITSAEVMAHDTLTGKRFLLKETLCLNMLTSSFLFLDVRKIQSRRRSAWTTESPNEL